jgi:hypothetical protein
VEKVSAVQFTPALVVSMALPCRALVVSPTATQLFGLEHEMP